MYVIQLDPKKKELKRGKDNRLSSIQKNQCSPEPNKFVPFALKHNKCDGSITCFIVFSLNITHACLSAKLITQHYYIPFTWHSNEIETHI